ncbi:MAG TPA: hypothetical protein DHV64_05050 [Erythrobacter sp.]|jgi:hypothetical protein|nr:hypothetical protein [Erythrobacter sp.]|tara:strand:- start:3093 stop:3782 length:690 start_codon:yes stop_codon:yes gene_type:complete
MTKQTTKKPTGSTTTATEKAAAKPRETTIGKVIALLKRKDGATLDEIIEATGWLPHTSRAALTGLKKKGAHDRARQAGRKGLLPHHQERVIMARLEDQLAKLDTMVKGDLKERWAKLTGRPVPQVSAKLLRMALAHEIQAKALRGLSRKTRQRLDQAATAKTETKDVRAGMRLAREFGGKVHVVTIGDAGEILWNEREWRSLSEVARAITGTRWSGPAFFGLRQKRKAA